MSETKYEVVKFIDDNIELDVNIEPYSETIWLTQSQMSILFGVDISRISRHIKNALNEEEINSQRNLRKTQIANSDKLVYLYDLDVIISVGYRVKSIKGVIFRKWATKVLKEYLLAGYVINKERSLVTNENYVRLINKVESLNLDENTIKIAKLTYKYRYLAYVIDSNGCRSREWKDKTHIVLSLDLSTTKSYIL